MRQVLFVLITLAGLLAVAPVLAQPAQPDAEQLRALADLLRDPAIQTWLQAQAEGVPAGAPQASAAAGDAAMVRQVMAGRLDAMRAFLRPARGGGPDAARRAPPGLDPALGRDSGARAAQAWSCSLPCSLPSASAWSGCTVGWDPEFARACSRADFETKRERLRAIGLRAFYGLCVLARLRHRQRRRLPAVRVAAAAQGDRARLSHGLSDRAPGPRARPFPARARRRALSGHPHGDAERPVLVRLVGRPRGLVSRSFGSRSMCWRCSASAGRRAIWSGCCVASCWSGSALYVVWRHPDRESGERRAAAIGSAPGCFRSTSSSSGCWRSPGRRRPSTWASSCCCCRSRSGAPIWR